MVLDSDAESGSPDLRSDDNYDDEEYAVRKDQDSPDERAGKRYTEEEEKRVVKKFDTRLVLFMALLYLLSFLDRSSECSFFSTQYLRSIYINISCRLRSPYSCSSTLGIY